MAVSWVKLWSPPVSAAFSATHSAAGVRASIFGITTSPRMPVRMRPPSCADHGGAASARRRTRRPGIPRRTRLPASPPRSPGLGARPGAPSGTNMPCGSRPVRLASSAADLDLAPGVGRPGVDLRGDRPLQAEPAALGARTGRRSRSAARRRCCGPPRREAPGARSAARRPELVFQIIELSRLVFGDRSPASAGLVGDLAHRRDGCAARASSKSRIDIANWSVPRLADTTGPRSRA